MCSPVELVRARLDEVGFPAARLHVVPGFIEEAVRSPGLPAAVSFAFVDFDFYEPIGTALAYLDRVLVPGGIVMVHDYGFFSTGAKAAVDELVGAHSARYRVDVPDGVLRHVCCLRREVDPESERQGVAPPSAALVP